MLMGWNAGFSAPSVDRRKKPGISERSCQDGVFDRDRFARNIGYGGDPPMYTYEDIVRAGHEAVRDGGHCWGIDARADCFRQSGDNRREFFRNWSLVTGVALPEEAQEGIAFRCACYVWSEVPGVPVAAPEVAPVTARLAHWGDKVTCG
jgi:hypothetical protein